jgi:hypothetical protein
MDSESCQDLQLFQIVVSYMFKANQPSKLSNETE